MKKFYRNLRNVAKVPHLSVTLIVSLILEILPIWFPLYREQCNGTMKILMLYGIAVAANTAPHPLVPPVK